MAQIKFIYFRHSAQVIFALQLRKCKLIANERMRKFSICLSNTNEIQ